jgi:hypothetical protein
LEATANDYRWGILRKLGTDGAFSMSEDIPSVPGLFGARTHLIHHFIQFEITHQTEFADPPARPSDITLMIEKQGPFVGFDLLNAEELKDW